MPRFSPVSTSLFRRAKARPASLLKQAKILSKPKPDFAEAKAPHQSSDSLRQYSSRPLASTCHQVQSRTPKPCFAEPAIHKGQEVSMKKKHSDDENASSLDDSDSGGVRLGSGGELGNESVDVGYNSD